MSPHHPASARDTSPKVSVVSDFLASQGVLPDAIPQKVAEILGIHVQTARRRLESQEGFSLGELLSISKHYDAFLPAWLMQAHPSARRAVLNVQDTLLPCYITLDNRLTESANLVAYEEPDGWHVCLPTDLPSGVTGRSVANMQISTTSSAPRVLILDDMPPPMLFKFLSGRGYNVSHHKTNEAALHALNSGERWNAYVIDYTMDHNVSSLPVISKINELDPFALKILLTGTVDDNHEQQVIIGRIVIEHNMEYYEKPVRLQILADRIELFLKRNRQINLID